METMPKISSDQPLSLSAAGRTFKLGMVYNAYNHLILDSLNLLDKYPKVGTKSIPCPSQYLNMKSSYTMNERMEAFEFDGHMKVAIGFKFLTLASASASARYIRDMSSSIGQARTTLRYKHVKRHEQLDMEAIKKLSGNYVVLESARENGATHFVVGMSYGNQVLLDFKFTKQHNMEHDLMDIQLEGSLRLGQFLADYFNKDKKQMTNCDNIQWDVYCDSKDIKRPTSFEEVQEMYQSLPTILKDVEAVDRVYLLPLSFIDKLARKFKQSDIDEVTMENLVLIRDDLHEQKLQCDDIEKMGIDLSEIRDDIKKYTYELAAELCTTHVKRWNELVVKHNSSSFQVQKLQHRIKELVAAQTCRIKTIKGEFAQAVKYFKVPSLKRKKYSLFVSIDIGTAYSWYAFQTQNDFDKDPTKFYAPEEWNGGQQNPMTNKTPTCLLLDKDKKIHSFGFEADDKYAELCLNKANQEWYYFRRFPMKLQERQGLNKDSQLEDETGKKMSTLQVFSLYIQCLMNRLNIMLEKQRMQVRSEEIHWVLTVPAIWNESAKQFMRMAAEQAGILSDNLDIALDSEATTPYCQYIHADKFYTPKGQVHMHATATSTKCHHEHYCAREAYGCKP